MFTLRRGELLLAVNFGDEPATVKRAGELLFTTPTPAVVRGDAVELPPHSGVLARERSS